MLKYDTKLFTDPVVNLPVAASSSEIRDLVTFATSADHSPPLMEVLRAFMGTRNLQVRVLMCVHMSAMCNIVTHGYV